MGYRVDVLDRAEKPGGMLAHALPAFRMSEEVLTREIDGLIRPEMQFRFGKALGEHFTVTDLENDYEAVFLAPGLWAGRELDVPGAEKAETTDALRLLCDYRREGRVDVGNQAVIVGGGSVATDVALAAKGSGAEKVSLVCLEGEGEMPALASELEELKRLGVEIRNGWGPREILSEARISFVRCMSVFDEQKRFEPTYDETESMDMDFDDLVWAIGQAVEPPLAAYLKKEFGCNGLIPVHEGTMQVTGRPGVFAGGDIVRGAGTVVEAVADGRRAAGAIHARLTSSIGERP
jgi:NADPH-dependent glutamate synthase beta subunit-like oxidoreductase